MIISKFKIIFGSLSKAIVGPVDLGGMKSGFQFSAEFHNDWTFRSVEANNFLNLEDLPAAIENGFANMPGIFKKTHTSEIRYSGPKKGQNPILNLHANVATWKTGDKIVVAATSWDPKESEVFSIVECPECTEFQVLNHILQSQSNF